jgi:hypothetical protein
MYAGFLPGKHALFKANILLQLVRKGFRRFLKSLINAPDQEHGRIRQLNFCVATFYIN